MLKNIFFFLIFSFMLLQLLEAQSRKCIYIDNSIECSDATVSELVTAINELTKEYSLSFISTLDLYNIHFENNEIQRGWLNQTTVKYSALFIFRSNLSTIGPGAFSGRPLDSLTNLILGNIEILEINKQMFQDTKLMSLTIVFDIFREVIIESNALEHISGTLFGLTLRACVTSETLENLTGPAASLTALTNLNLHYNDLSNLRASTFVGASKLSSLYLASSNISTIEQGTFDQSILSRLDLSSNRLTTLPTNLFRYVRTGININYNKWNCDCDLIWLRNMFYYYPQYFTHSSFYCTTPEGDVSYENIEFCPGNKKI